MLTDLSDNPLELYPRPAALIIFEMDVLLSHLHLYLIIFVRVVSFFLSAHYPVYAVDSILNLLFMRNK
jgi:hypothetical protein